MNEPTYRQNPEVVARSVDDSVFLINDRTGTVYHLNRLGAALWRLLADPTPLPAAIAIVRDAFPDQDPTRVERDISRLVASLMKRQLIESDPPPGNAT